MTLKMPTLDGPFDIYLDDSRPSIGVAWMKWEPCPTCEGGFKKALRDFSTTAFSFTADFIIERTNTIIYHKTTGIDGYDGHTWPNVSIQFDEGELQGTDLTAGLYLCRLRAHDLFDDTHQSTRFRFQVRAIPT